MLQVHLDPPAGWLPGQARATGLVEDPDGPTFVLLSGGQGAGKTWWLALQGLRLHFLNMNHHMTRGGDPNEIWGALLSASNVLLKKSVGPTLTQILAAVGLDGYYRWNRQDGILQFEDPVSKKQLGGLYTFTAENPDYVIGANISYALVDEPGTPTKGDALFRLVGRLRGPGYLRKVAMAGTPEDIVKRAWFYDAFASPEARLRYGPEGDNSRAIVYAATHDNVHLDDLEGYIGRQRQVLTKQQQRAYLYGEFVMMAEGRAYAGFLDYPAPAGHVLPNGHPDLEPLPNAPLCVSWDFNVSPMCGVVAWPRGGDTLVVVDEIRIPNAGRDGEPAITLAARTFADRWGGVLAERKAPLEVHGDATETRRTAAASHTGWTLMHNALGALAKSCGVEYRPRVPHANPREIDRVNTMNAAFENRRVYVAERCAHLRKDLGLVQFKEGTNQLDKLSDKSLTHLSDALGYLYWSRCGTPAVRGELPALVMADELELASRWDWGTV